MTRLSVNLNKIALLRNSRGRDYPNVCEYANKFIQLGVHGITIHPRSDERHVTRQDVYDLAELLQQYPGVELNIEGYPTEDFLAMVTTAVKPQQCTLVPDTESQLTSDHGWDVVACQSFLQDCLMRLRSAGIRNALFINPDLTQIEAVENLDCDRIELYTEEYAKAYYKNDFNKILQTYLRSAKLAQSKGLGVNAGHDLDLNNLETFLRIDNILEVSVGHALTVECIDYGLENVVRRYLEICAI